MDDIRVPYDSEENRWKFGRMLSKFPSDLLTESLVFTPTKVMSKKSDDIKNLNKKNEDTETSNSLKKKLFICSMKCIY